MSDNYITFVPKDPYFAPAAAAVERVVARLAKLAPKAEHIIPIYSDNPAFYGAGSNLSDIQCPTCGASLELEWWKEVMDNNYQDGIFHLSEFDVPCCSTKQTLNTLQYDWPQAFGVFAIEAMNPNIGQLNAQVIDQMNELLVTKLIVVYQHL